MNLSDLCEISVGGTPSTKNQKFWNGKLPWISVKDFNNDFRYVYDTEKYITEDGVKYSNTKLLEIGDIIISVRGSVGALIRYLSSLDFPTIP